MSETTSGPGLAYFGRREKWISLGILSSIVVLGIFLRFYELGVPSLNSDGIQIVKRALGTATGYAFGNALIFTKLLRLLLLIFPQNDFFVRIPSAVFGVAAIPLIYVVGARLLQRSTAMVAAFLLAVSVLHIHQSRHVHSYTLLMLLSLWSIYLMSKALETNRIRDWLILGVCNGLAILAHQFAVFYIASEIVIIIVVLLFGRPAGVLEGLCVWRAVAARLAISIALTVVIALPVVVQIGTPLTNFFSSVGSNDTAFMGGGLDPSMWLGFLARIVHDFSSFPPSSPVRAFTILGMFLFGLGTLIIRHRKIGLSAALWLLLSLMPVILFTQLSGLNFHSRRLIFLLPVWILILAYGVSSVGEWVTSRLARSGRARLAICTISILAVGGIGWLFAGAPSQRYLANLRTSSLHWKEIASFLDQVTVPEDKIVIWPERSIRYYFPHPERTVEEQHWDSQAADREINDGQRYWFVFLVAYQQFFPDRAQRVEDWILDHDLVSFDFDSYVRIAYSSDHPAGSLARIKEKVSVLQGAINAYPAGKKLRRYLKEAVTRRQILQKIIGEILGGVKREGESDGDVRLLLAGVLTEDFPGEALSYYEMGIGLNPNDGSAHFGRGKVLLALKRYNEGISSLRKAYEMSNGSAAPGTELDGSVSDQGRIEEVIAVVEDAAARVGSGPDWFFLRLERARLFHETSAVGEAISTLEDTFTQAKNKDGSVELPMIDYNVSADLAPFVDMMKALHEIYPENIPIQSIGSVISLSLAEALVGESEIEAAAPEYQAFLDFSATPALWSQTVRFAYVCVAVAKRQDRNGKFAAAHATRDLALRAFEYAFMSDLQQEYRDYIVYGRLLAERDRFDEAARVLNEAIGLNPRAANAWANLCAVYRRWNRTADAMKACRQALRLNPNHFYCNLWMAQMLSSSARWSEAVDAARIAAQHSPSERRRCESLNILAQAFTHAEDTGQACKVYREMVGICVSADPGRMLEQLGCSD